MATYYAEGEYNPDVDFGPDRSDIVALAQDIIYDARADYEAAIADRDEEGFPCYQAMISAEKEIEACERAIEMLA